MDPARVRGVSKTAGPSFRQQIRPLRSCPGCNASGMVQGLFHQMPCNDCNATGLVDNETGQALAPENMVIQLRLRLNRQREENDELRRQLLDQAKQDNGRGYGPGGQRYHGD
jgi:hypothetical protein